MTRKRVNTQKLDERQKEVERKHNEMIDELKNKHGIDLSHKKIQRGKP